MIDAEIGTLDQVSVRDVWRKEDKDFTPWLAENVDLISDALGMDLELEGQEVPVGGYSADLVLNDISTDSRVVVENMYGSTDHDHIGKLITYAAGLSASYAVLLAETFRPEHCTALNWLNSISSDERGFFGLSLEIWRIGHSSPAPRLRVDVRPDNWSKSVRATKSRSENERAVLLRRFWGEMRSSFRQDNGDWALKGEPPSRSWMVLKRRGGIAFTLAFFGRGANRHLRAEAFIRSGTAASSAELYATLEARRGEIEASFGEEPGWEPIVHRIGSRVSTHCPEPMSQQDEYLWPQARDWAVPTLGRLRAAIEPVLDKM